jgi:hypothetical protein
MSDGSISASKGPCAKIVLAVFGGFFLIALLSVPVTTTESSLREDAGSRLIFRTTYPKNSTMFLPSYLAAKTGGEGGTVRVRSAQWIGTMAIILVLGIFDHFILCRMWQRSRRRGRGLRQEDGEEPGTDRRSSGISLFP